MNIKEIARVMDTPYSTVRKYLNALVEAGILSASKTPKGVEFEDRAVEVLKRLIESINTGESLSSAIEKLKASDPSQNFQIVLDKLEKLEKENRSLREIVQVYLSKIDNLERQLMPPKKEKWFDRVLKIFKR